MRGRRFGWIAVVAAALVGAGLVLMPPTSATSDPRAVAEQRLRSDADGRVTLLHASTGGLSFVGTASGVLIENPAVDRHDSVRRAADAHVDRYGAALAASGASTFGDPTIGRTVSGVDTVRYQQQVGGVPVLGGEVVLGLGSRRELRSLAADVTGVTAPTAATVRSEAAVATARGLVARAHPDADLETVDHGRWILDPVVAGLDLPDGVRTVRRVEVTDGAGVRELVLVDDRSGRVAFQVDLIQHVDRVVCDRANVRGPESTCTAGFARTEASGPSGVVDVEDAFAFSGETASFYASVGGIDLTDLLGVDVGGQPKLASTVRFCLQDLAEGCPYSNAFWNGTQMFYGAGFAAADDVVGHEMTHGFVDQFSQLFYWGQSGAINESMADIIGEIVDHRNGSDDDSAWLLGEALTGVGPFRSMESPPLHGDPDRMGSALYDADASYADGGGVHSNSGVGNKTAYLISQGGAFNGQTISGIDVGDPGLTKTGRLYLDVIQRAASGTDYADLALLLDQSCSDLRAAASPGFTDAVCTAVHQAGLATELSQTPANASQPADADVSCPVGTVKQVLFHSETGSPAEQAAKLANVTSTDPQFIRGSSRDWGSNATSGTASWFVPDTRTAKLSVLRAAAAVALPAGQESFLSFQGWYLLDYDSNAYYDGGLVQLAVDGGLVQPSINDVWVNGPTRPLTNGRKAFSGDSRGWIRSRLDLSDKAGHTVRPQFNLYTDSDPVGFDYSMIGWFLDDISLYTCAPLPGPVKAVSTTGTPRTSAIGPVRQRINWQAPALNPGAVTGYRVLVDGVTRATSAASARSVDLALTTTTRHTITVRAIGANGYLASAVQTTTVPSTVSLTVKRSGTTVTLTGVLKRAGSGFGGRKVWVERKSGTTWVTVGSVTTAANGSYVVKTSRSTTAGYRVRFPGSPGVTGSFSPTRTG